MPRLRHTHLLGAQKARFLTTSGLVGLFSLGIFVMGLHYLS